MPTSNTTLWYTRCSVPTPFGIAEQRGWFDEELAADKDVEILALQSSPDPKVHQSHYTHTQPNSFRQGGNYPAIWARANGSDTRVIGLSWIEAPQAVLVGPESNLRSVADLKGKRLLIVRRPHEPIDFPYATTLRTYEKVLATAGLTLKDVELVERTVDRSFINDHHGASLSRNENVVANRRSGGFAQDSLVALLSGKVDAIASGGVQVLQFEKLVGTRVLFDAGNLPDKFARANNSYPFTFAVNADLIERRPDLVARLYARVLEAVDWAKIHPADAIRHLAREQAVSEELVELTYGDGLAAGLETDLAADKIEALRLQKDFLLRHGLITKDFDVEKWIDHRPLQAALKILEERRRKPGYPDSVANRSNALPAFSV